MSEFARNKYGQLVYIPTVERMALNLGLSITTVARLMQTARNVYRDENGMVLPLPSNPGFQYPELRRQDLTAPLKNDKDRKVEV